MKDYKNPRELLEYIQKAAELNPDYTAQEILEAALERGDTLGGIKVTDIIEQNNDFATSLVEAINKPAKEIDLSGLDLSFEEPKEISDSTSIIESNGGEAIEKKELGSERNYDILKNIYDRYMQLVNAKKDLVTEYNGGKGLPANSEKRTEYEKQLKILNDELKEIEDGDELYNVISSIKEDGLGEKTGDNDSRAAHWLNVIMSKKSEDDEPRGWLKQNIFGNKLDDATKRGFKMGFNEGIDKYLEGHKGNKKEDKKVEKEEVKENKGTEKITGPVKQNTIKDNKTTDDMSFGEDVAGAGGNDYLEERNKTLATHLAVRGITTPEEIDEYLSKYPSWQNAKQEWKDNTLSILEDKVSKIKPQVKEEKKEDEKVIDETKKEDGDKGKKFSIGDRKNINFKTDNDSPLNDEEDVSNNQLRANEYLKNGYKIKNGKFYTPSGVLVEQNGNNLSETGEWVPAKKSKDKLETASDWNDFWNNDNDSPINGTEDEKLENENDWNNFWNEDQKKETKKAKSSPLKKANKETKKEDKKETNKGKKINIVKGSETIKNLLKSKK